MESRVKQMLTMDMTPMSFWSLILWESVFVLALAMGGFGALAIVAHVVKGDSEKTLHIVFITAVVLSVFFAVVIVTVLLVWNKNWKPILGHMLTLIKDCQPLTKDLQQSYINQ
jgi:hypothetical protein